MDGYDRPKLFIKKGVGKMQEGTKKERIEKYGSFLFCPKKERLCFAINNDEGICERAICYSDDPKWIAQQKRIEKNIEENAKRELEEKRKKKERLASPAVQAKDAARSLKEKIKSKEEFARKLYRTNKPRAGDAVMHEAAVLRSRLAKLRR